MRKWYPVTLIVLAFAASIAVFNRLPDRIPTHFDAAGNPNGWSSRLVGAFLLPVITLVTWPLMRLLPRIDPRRANYAKFQSTYDALIYTVLTMLVVVHGLILASALGLPVRFERAMPIVVGIMLVIVGNVLPRARPNWFFGIRTPWTLSSDRVWERTHRVGGYLMLAAGVVIIATAWLPPVAGSVAMGIAAAVAALGSIGYSYVLWRREQHDAGGGTADGGEAAKAK